MSSYFNSSNKRGEIQELTNLLNSIEIPKKLEALKKIIAQMTIGKDVSTLFQQVIKCLEHPEIELKKLVYLYIINYSRNKPDDAIMVINLFRKDVMTGTPLIKGLALRTMGCIRVKKLNEYLCDPLKQGLNDDDAYVRKTACLCVPKVYELNATLVEQNGLITKLQQILKSDNNPLVIANTCLALYEISQIKGQSVLTITPQILQKLLIAVNECMEWGEVFILECLTIYTPSDSSEAETIIERIIPRLSHINPSVVFATIKIIIKYLDLIDNQESIKNFTKKICQPLVTLVNWDQPEIQYVILRNVGFLLQKRPNIMEKEIKVFYCKFNDPYYIKLEKIDIVVKLTDSKNYEQVLNELREYACEVNQEFVRKVIKSICIILLNLEKAVDKGVELLLSLLKESSGQQDHLINEIMISFQQIYRRYPSKFLTNNSSLLELVQYFQFCTEAEAKSSAIWMLGEYCDLIDDSIQQIGQYVEQVKEEDRIVQLALITATVKVFLKYPDQAQSYITQILKDITENTENPDIRDRAYIYWRMLSSDPAKTKSIVFGKKPAIRSDSLNYETNFANQMIDNLASISSVLHKQPHEVFKKPFKFPVQNDSPTRKSSPEKKDTTAQQKETQNTKILSGETQKTQKEQTIKPVQKSNTADLLDLLGDTIQTTNVQQSTPQVNNSLNDLNNIFNFSNSSNNNNSNVNSSNNNKNTQNAFDFDLLDVGSTTTVVQPQQQQNPQIQNKSKKDSLDFLDEDDSDHNKAQENQYHTVLNENITGINGQKGLKILGCFERNNGQLRLNLKLHNQNNSQIDDIQIQIRPNFFKLGIENDQKITLKPKQEHKVILNVNDKGQEDMAPPTHPLLFNLGIKCSLDIFLCSIPCSFHNLLIENGKLTKDAFKQQWKAISEQNEVTFEVKSINQQFANPDNLKFFLNQNNIFFMAQRKNNEGQNVMYLTSRSINNSEFLVEISVPSLSNPNGCTLSVKSQQQFLIQNYIQCLNSLLSN